MNIFRFWHWLCELCRRDQHEYVTEQWLKERGRDE